MKKPGYLWIVFPLIMLVACENYGDKVAKDNVEVFFKDGISRETAQQVLDYLYPSWNDSTTRKSVQLVKQRDTATFRMVVDEQRVNKIGEDVYYLLANELSSEVFKGAPVNLEFTDESFRTLRSIPFRKVDLPDYGVKHSSGNIDVYAASDSLAAESQQMAIFLDRLDEEENVRKSFRVEKEADVYVVKMVTDSLRSKMVADQVFYDLAKQISDSSLQGRSLILRMTNNRFEPINREFRYR